MYTFQSRLQNEFIFNTFHGRGIVVHRTLLVATIVPRTLIGAIKLPRTLIGATKVPRTFFAPIKVPSTSVARQKYPFEGELDPKSPTHNNSIKPSRCSNHALLMRRLIYGVIVRPSCLLGQGCLVPYMGQNFQECTDRVR